MIRIKLRIVGFPFGDFRDCVETFLDSALGEVLVLWPDPDNEFDHNAIRVYDCRGNLAGYVSREDLPMAHGAFLSANVLEIEGVVVRVDKEHPCAILEVEVGDNYLPVDNLGDREKYLRWEYNGPVLPVPEIVGRLGFMMHRLEWQLQKRASWSDTARSNYYGLVENFARLSTKDISCEMCDYRHGLTQQLEGTGDAELMALSPLLKRASSRSGRETRGGEVFDFWLQQLSDESLGMQLLRRANSYSPEAVEQQLEQFPDQLYDMWQTDRSHLVARMLYLQIPRKALWKFVSGIAFVELCRKMTALPAEAPAPVPQCESLSSAPVFKDCILSLQNNTIHETVVDMGQQIAQQNVDNKSITMTGESASYTENK